MLLIDYRHMSRSMGDPEYVLVVSQTGRNTLLDFVLTEHPEQFGLTEATYTVIRLAQHFKAIENRDTLPWTESISLTATSANGVKVAMTVY